MRSRLMNRAPSHCQRYNLLTRYYRSTEVTVSGLLLLRSVHCARALFERVAERSWTSHVPDFRSVQHCPGTSKSRRNASLPAAVALPSRRGPPLFCLRIDSSVAESDSSWICSSSGPARLRFEPALTMVLHAQG